MAVLQTPTHDTVDCLILCLLGRSLLKCVSRRPGSPHVFGSSETATDPHARRHGSRGRIVETARIGNTAYKRTLTSSAMRATRARRAHTSKLVTTNVDAVSVTSMPASWPEASNMWRNRKHEAHESRRSIGGRGRCVCSRRVEWTPPNKRRREGAVRPLPTWLKCSRNEHL
jgi:hypothetical protein